MAQEIIPDKQSVLTCLKQKVYYVDFYQREYVWTKNTVEILLNDIFYAFEISYKEHKDEEMSQEVLEKYNWYYLNVFITNKVEGKVFIVDGQQRLSTLTLIATKLYHITKNDNLRDILRDCIFAKDQFKGNVFCIDNDKRKNVMQCILDGSEYQDAYKNKTEETIIERYADISKFFDDKQLDDVELTAFIYYFLNRLVLVELSIQKDDTPMVFEVINDRGEALKPFEILKGKMIGLLSKSDTNKYSEKWDAALNRISGREDNFFADYLKSQFVFKKNASLEKQIINSYHRYIFDYNDIANKLSFRRADKKHHENIKLFINNELDYYTSLYAKISTCGDEFVQYNLNINDISGLYQQIMAACDVNDELTDEKIHAIAKEADRLWVLFVLNGIYDSNDFQDVSYRLNEKLKGLDMASYREVYDEIILQSIREKRNVSGEVSLLDFNSFLRKNYTNTNRRFLRYLFSRVEKFICEHTNQNMQNDIYYISTKTGNKTGYHIEHILSENEKNREGIMRETIISFVEELLQRNICFEFYQNLVGIVPQLCCFVDKTFIEYKTQPGAKIKIHYLLDNDSQKDEKEYEVEEMPEMYNGIFVKAFSLFDDEVLQYYITENVAGEEQVTESNIIFGSDRHYVMQEGRFSRINDILVSLSVQDTTTAWQLVEEYMQQDFCARELFRVL